MNIEAKADSIFYKRQSPRNFTDQEVSKMVLMTLFEAARWAPSSFNEQPWRFIIGKKNDETTGEIYDKLFSCLNEFNQEWASDAPVLILTLTKTKFSKTGEINEHALHDLGLAMGNLINQATMMGLVVHQMGGFSNDKAKEVFKIDEGLDSVAIAAIGYPSDYKTDRERKDLEELFLNEI